MTAVKQLDPNILGAIGKIEDFILRTTGEAATPVELSAALTRYFVMKEITDFVILSRGEEEDASASKPSACRGAG